MYKYFANFFHTLCLTYTLLKVFLTVLTTFLLSGLCQPYKERYSGSCSKCRTCTTFNLCPISNSWTVYEGEITIGVAGCESPHLSAQNMYLKDFQSLGLCVCLCVCVCSMRVLAF